MDEALKIYREAYFGARIENTEEVINLLENMLFDQLDIHVPTGCPDYIRIQKRITGLKNQLIRYSDRLENLKEEQNAVCNKT